MNADEIRRRVGEVTWHHSIDLGQGIVTPGASNVEPLSDGELPNFVGRSVLDIGAWDGFYSFRAEGSGASRVVAPSPAVKVSTLPKGCSAARSSPSWGT